MDRETLEELIEYALGLASSGESNLSIKRALRDRAQWLKGPQVQEVMGQVGRRRTASRESRSQPLAGTASHVTPGTKPQRRSSRHERTSRSGSTHRSSGRLTVNLAEVDEAFIGLAFLAGELRRHWKLGYSGRLAFWRQTRGHGRPPTDRSGFRRWVAKGGEGRFLLFPDAVKEHLKTRGLDAQRVMVDLKDRGVTEADPGHSTKQCWTDGKAKRFIVLPDRFVKQRSPWTLGSAVGLNS